MKGSTTMDRCAASAGAFDAIGAVRFPARRYHAPAATRTSNAASAAASGASPKRLFCGVGAAGVTGSAGFVGFGFAGTPTCSE